MILKWWKSFYVFFLFLLNWPHVTFAVARFPSHSEGNSRHFLHYPCVSPLLSTHHQFIPSLGRRAGISLETACHTAHSQHQTVAMHRHHSPPLPAACSQFTTLQFTSNQRAVPPPSFLLVLISHLAFPRHVSFGGHGMLPIHKDVFNFLLSAFVYFSNHFLSMP